jgi:uncharacterized protein
MARIAAGRSSPEASEKNVAIVQAMYAEFARRDIAAILGRLADDVVWAEPDNPWNPAAGTRRGHAGFLEWARVGSASEEILSLDVHQIIADTDRVIVVGHTRCRVRITGKTYDTDFIHLVTLHNGRVSRFQEFFDTYAAAEAFRPEPERERVRSELRPA